MVGTKTVYPIYMIHALTHEIANSKRNISFKKLSSTHGIQTWVPLVKIVSNRHIRPLSCHQLTRKRKIFFNSPTSNLAVPCIKISLNQSNKVSFAITGEHKPKNQQQKLPDSDWVRSPGRTRVTRGGETTRFTSSTRPSYSSNSRIPASGR